jgi:hypothetical protein
VLNALQVIVNVPVVKVFLITIIVLPEARTPLDPSVGIVPVVDVTTVQA